MAVTLHKLTEKIIRNAGKGLHADGGNLYLQVTATGAKSWIFRYEANGKQKSRGLGPLHTVTLAEARDKAVAMRKLLVADKDPTEALRSTAPSFSEAFAAFKLARGKAWTNAKHSKQWDMTITTYGKSLLDLRVDEITTNHVVEVLQPVWHRIPETSRRLQQRIEAILTMCIARQWRGVPNPATWRGNLEAVFKNTSTKKKAVKHHRALAYKDAPHFVHELRQRPALSARMFELAILTGSRSQEVRLAKWEDVDLDEGVWTKPAALMKTGKAHVVTLGPGALDLLKAVRGYGLAGPYVFPSTQAAKGRPKPHSNMAMLGLLDRMGWRERTTAHGFRSVLTDWAHEETQHARHVVEMALAHAIENAVEAAYRRGELLEKRKALLTDWEAFLNSYVPPQAE